MKKALLALLFLFPSVTFAAPFVKDSYIATDNAATSSFAGSLSVDGQAKIGVLNGILSAVGGLLSSITVQAPLSFVNGILSIIAPGSDRGLFFNDNGSFETMPLSYTQDGNFVTLVGEDGNLTRFLSDTGFKADLVTNESISADFSLERDGAVFDWYNNGKNGFLLFTTGDRPHTTELYGTDGIQLRTASGGVEISGGPLLSYTNLDFKSLFGSYSFRGIIGTTTINFGEIGSSTAKTCFNTKNTEGGDISFYFVGTTMVVENNVCN